MPATILNKITGEVEPLHDYVLVVNMEKGDTITKGGIHLLDDNGKERGIRPRWCQVWRVGPDQTDVSPGQWIFVEHGRWSYGIEVTIPEGEEDEVFYVQRVDLKGILGVTDDYPL